MSESSDPSDNRNIGKHEAPPKCLSFSVSGPFAHFRKVETTSTRLTYSIPPRTTINGLIAAILGLESNSYYELFALNNSAIATSIEKPIREYGLAENHQGTKKNDLQTAGTSVYNLKMTFTKPNTDTQRINHSVLRDVSYRFDVWMDDQEMYDELKSKLEEGKAQYTPSLGLSEFLAKVTYHGEFETEPVDTDSEHNIESAIPSGTADINIKPRVSITSERSPSEMKRIENPFPNRRTTDFTTYQFKENGNPITATSDCATKVGDRIVIFA